MAKKRTGDVKSREVMYIQMNEVYRDIDRKKYEESKQAYANSEKGIFEAQIRATTQKATEREEALYREYKEIMKELREDTLNDVKAYLGRYDEKVGNLPMSVIRAVLKEASLEFGKLKKMCNAEHYVERLNPLHPTEYEKLFIELIDGVDVRFALFAPKRSLARISIKFEKLPEELKDEMFARLEEFGYMDNEKYREAYEIVFRKQLESKGYSL